MLHLTWAEFLTHGDTPAWFYDGQEDPDQIYGGDVEDAVVAVLDDAHPEIPDEVTVYAFARCTSPDAEEEAADVLENLLAHLDEEYGDPDGGATEPTPAMVETMRIAIRTVLASYDVWRCEPVAEIVVRRVDLPHLWAGFVKCPACDGSKRKKYPRAGDYIELPCDSCSPPDRAPEMWTAVDVLEYALLQPQNRRINTEKEKP